VGVADLAAGAVTAFTIGVHAVVRARLRHASVCAGGRLAVYVVAILRGGGQRWLRSLAPAFDGHEIAGPAAHRQQADPEGDEQGAGHGQFSRRERYANDTAPEGKVPRAGSSPVCACMNCREREYFSAPWHLLHVLRLDLVRV
jgi:hypothetical protein